MACRHSSQLELRIVLHVPSLEVTIVRNLMSCGYRFPEFGRHTPLCWPAPFVILNPDSIATVLPTNTPADGSWCCITTGVRYSACSAALILQDRENPRYVQHVGKRFSQTYLRRASQRKNRASGGSSMPRAVLWLDRDWNHTTDPCDG
jgi:hypothetical protein